eukprot:1145365-Pelagomonas_calceolata.AAC.1
MSTGSFKKPLKIICTDKRAVKRAGWGLRRRLSDAPLRQAGSEAGGQAELRAKDEPVYHRTKVVDIVTVEGSQSLRAGL